MIDENMLIERLEKEMLQSTEAKAEAIIGMCGASANAYCGEVDAYEKAIEIVKDLAEEHNNGWIPCSERLPDVEADALLSLRSLDVYTGFRANTEGCFYVEGEGYVEFENVLAWKPLPAPYKKGEMI